MSEVEQFISSELERLGLCNSVKNVKTLGGGCISQAACYKTDKGDYFVKVSSCLSSGAVYRYLYGVQRQTLIPEPKTGLLPNLWDWNVSTLLFLVSRQNQ